MSSKIIKSKKRIKVLITGAYGFVGSKILKALIHEDAEITLVLRDTSSPKEKISHSIKKIIYSDDIFSESVDWWADSCHEVDVVVHSAWYAEPGKYLKSMKNLNCLEGSVRLAKGAAKANKPLDVYSKLSPLTLYASSKLSLYYLLKEFLRLKNIKFTWCRLFYLYGDGEDDRRFIPYLKNQLKNGEVAELTSGDKVRDFMDVEDAGKVITKTIVHPQDGVVNVCSGKPVTIREMAEKIADKYGRRELLKFGAREDNLIDPDYVVGIPNII